MPRVRVLLCESFESFFSHLCFVEDAAKRLRHRTRERWTDDDMFCYMFERFGTGGEHDTVDIVIPVLSSWFPT